jgi:hypothetical protein
VERRYLAARFSGAACFAEQAGSLTLNRINLPMVEPQPLEDEHLVLRLEIAGVGSADASASVVELVVPHGFSLKLDDSEMRRVLRILASCRKREELESGPRTVALQWLDPRDMLKVQGGDEESRLSNTAYERVRTMTGPEKIQLALRSHSRAERLALIKDPNKALQVNVIENPDLTLDEVIYLASYPQANPEVLRRISKHKEWPRRTRILNALINNPKTPKEVAVSLMSALPTPTIEKMAFDNSVPRYLMKAAQDLAMKRKGGPSRIRRRRH